MSVKYSVKSNTPTLKYAYALAGTTTFTIWTPASGKMIVLTDAIISGAAKGTVRLVSGSAASTTKSIVMECMIGSSAVINFHLQTPIEIPDPDSVIAAVSGANGFLGVTLLGYEAS